MTPNELIQLMQVIRHLVASDTENRHASLLLVQILEEYFPNSNSPPTEPSNSTSQQQPGQTNHHTIGPDCPDIMTPRFPLAPRTPQACTPPHTSTGPSGQRPPPPIPPRRVPEPLFPPAAPGNRRQELNTSPADWSFSGRVHQGEASTPNSQECRNPSSSKDNRRALGPGQSTPLQGQWIQCPYCNRSLNMNVEFGLDEGGSSLNATNYQEIRFRIALLPEHMTGLAGDGLFSTERSGYQQRSFQPGSLRDIIRRLPNSDDEFRRAAGSVIQRSHNYYQNLDANSTAEEGRLSYLANSQQQPPCSNAGNPVAVQRTGNQSQYVNIQDETGVSTISGEPQSVQRTPTRVNDAGGPFTRYSTGSGNPGASGQPYSLRNPTAMDQRVGQGMSYFSDTPNRTWSDSRPHYC